VLLDVLSVGYETFPDDLRKQIVTCILASTSNRISRRHSLGGFEQKTQTTKATCNEDICSHFIRDCKRSNFYDHRFRIFE
jgi:hypothetical protein